MLNLIVLRAREPRSLACFYEHLGLTFYVQKHGNGPEHLACETGGGILEIYPYGKSAQSTRAVRLAFVVSSLDERCLKIAGAGGKLLRAPKTSPWGKRATIEDPKGHLIDLTEIRVGSAERSVSPRFASNDRQVSARAG